jgi:mRNA interferase MazF
MAQMKRGEVWLVSLDPAIGHEMKKARPAVIIQNDLGNKHSPTTIVAPITSQHLAEVYPFEVPFELDKPSKVLLNHIRTVDKQRLLKKVGVVDASTMRLVDAAIKVSLGL